MNVYLRFEADESLAQNIQEKLYAMPCVQEAFVDRDTRPDPTLDGVLLSSTIVLVPSAASSALSALRSFVHELQSLTRDIKGLKRVTVEVGIESREISTLTDEDLSRLATRTRA